MAYATTAQLAAWLDVSEDDLPEGSARMLERASEVIDEVVVAPYPTGDDDVVAALADAACAQVEFWFEVGEEHDVAGQRGSISVEGMSISKLPGTLAPRARRALASQNLLTRSVMGA